jgi:hypothetical protein
VITAEPPSPDERYCAWFGDAREGVLYFGQAAFWSAMRDAVDDPLADLERAGPVPLGRFDLARERMLPSLELGEAGDRSGRSGVWDVLPHANGRIYYTVLFENSGWVDPATGEIQRWLHLGTGLNEIALGPDGTLLFSRYARDRGSIVIVDPDGTPVAEHELTPPDGFYVAPKTPAWDETRGWIWITTDILPAAGAVSLGSNVDAHHDAYVLGRDGREVRRIADRVVHFVAFGPDGTGYLAESRDGRLWMRVLAPEVSDPDGGTVIPLSQSFPEAFDVVQDIRVASDGRVLVTRWSGWVHVFDPAGRVRSVHLPPLEPAGLYYTAALRGAGSDRVCATHCGEVTVVCANLP